MNKFRKLLLILQVTYFRRAFLSTGVAASVEHNAFFKNLDNELLTIIDIGANKGQFALATRHFNPKAMIYSFEPLSEAEEIYKEIFSKDSMVELHPFAIGPTETKTTLYESRADDSSSLLPISDLQSRIYKGTEGVGKRDVDVKPLDCVLIKQDISSPALLKIDVQGYELQVLKGCRSLISYFDYIYVECSFMELYLGQPLANDVIAFLIDCDFCLSGVYNLDYDKRGLPVQADFLFISKES